MQIIEGSFRADREQIMEYSNELGFLTGEENKEMTNTHYKGVMIVGEPFRTEHRDDLYDFGTAGFTHKVIHLLPTLSKHRLTPPPEEVYSCIRRS